MGTEPVSEELNLDLDLALFSLIIHFTSVGLSFLISKMGWMLNFNKVTILYVPSTKSSIELGSVMLVFFSS